MRAGQEAAWPGKPCHGDVFHILHQGEVLENYLHRRAKGATSRREKLEEKMNKAKKKGQGNRWSKKLTVARVIEVFLRKISDKSQPGVALLAIADFFRLVFPVESMSDKTLTQKNKS